MRLASLALGLWLLACPTYAQTGTATTTVSPGAVQVIEGTWTGYLEYLDYTSEKLTQIPVRLAVRRLKEGQPNWEIAYFYTDEPHANETQRYRLAKQGTEWGGHRIVSASQGPGGALTLLTEANGKDNSQPAQLRYTLRVTGTELLLQKEVRYTGATDFVVRNRYVVQRD